jgi:hypothetical protein
LKGGGVSQLGREWVLVVDQKELAELGGTLGEAVVLELDKKAQRRAGNVPFATFVNNWSARVPGRYVIQFYRLTYTCKSILTGGLES